MEIKIVNRSHHPLPAYETIYSAGVDLRAFVESPIILNPLERALVPTGLFIELPVGTEAQVRPRSGLAFKKGITILNSPGTIDSDYRGEIKVIVINLSNQPVEIVDGERIAQMIISRCEKAQWIEVNELMQTDRGGGGFGHTGSY